jgi:hypothetical protein
MLDNTVIEVVSNGYAMRQLQPEYQQQNQLLEPLLDNKRTPAATATADKRTLSYSGDIILNDEYSFNSVESVVEFEPFNNTTMQANHSNSNNSQQSGNVDNVTVILHTNTLSNTANPNGNNNGHHSHHNHTNNNENTTSCNRTDSDLDLLMKSSTNSFCDIKDFHDDELSQVCEMIKSLLFYCLGKNNNSNFAPKFKGLFIGEIFQRRSSYVEQSE